MGYKSNCRYGISNPDNQLVATIVEEDVAFGPEKFRRFHQRK